MSGTSVIFLTKTQPRLTRMGGRGATCLVSALAGAFSPGKCAQQGTRPQRLPPSSPGWDLLEAGLTARPSLGMLAPGSGKTWLGTEKPPKDLLFHPSYLYHQPHGRWEGTAGAHSHRPHCFLQILKRLFVICNHKKASSWAIRATHGPPPGFLETPTLCPQGLLGTQVCVCAYPGRVYPSDHACAPAALAG